ncbi:hypothetical protein [Streptomyces turgidiscabies]|uniref:Uncharacterized protein n=1 Tax=Streptomyces turgidiscabies TaxID=85558 RepID=A0ABU0RPG6_9ACTN|nr:hypothetical protein [Streptomyces turgidiscabies]MDQ0933613.1 hypothetical protein [Streptomyces turgidiscabies]
MVTTPDTARAAAAEPHNPQAERLLARRRSVAAWCDRHLMAIHALSTLMTDNPGVVESALAEALTEPVALAVALGPGEYPAAVPSPPPARAAREHLPVTRDRCPDGAASPLDRVELALHLVGDRSCAAVSRTLGLPERSVAARLRSGLWVLFTPCDGDSGHSLRGRLSAVAADHRHGPS